MNELDTRTLLARMANEPAPLSTVDIDRAITVAQRHRQRTHWVAMAAAAVVVLVVTLGVVQVFRPEAQRPAPLLDAPSIFDPLNPRLEVGWLPKGFEIDMWNAAVTAEFAIAGEPGEKQSVQVYAIPRTGGFPAPIDLFRKPYDGPEIHGQPSKWQELAEPDRNPGAVVVQPGQSPSPTPSKSTAPPKRRADSITLRWEYAKGGQVEVEVHGFKDPKDIATRVARSVSLEHPKPFRMALEFSRPKIPVVRTGGGGNGSMVEFASPGWRRPSMILGIEKQEPGDYRFKRNKTFQGMQAREELIDSAVVWQIQIAPDHEFDLQCAAADDTAAGKKANRDACREVAASAKLVGSADDPTTWSDHPVR